MKNKSNLPPGALPPYFCFTGATVMIMEENVEITLQQLQLAIIETGIRGKLKEELHKVGILPLKENELSSVAANNMAAVIREALTNGTDLKVAFIEAGILPQNQNRPDGQLHHSEEVPRKAS